MGPLSSRVVGRVRTVFVTRIRILGINAERDRVEAGIPEARVKTKQGIERGMGMPVLGFSAALAHA